MRSFYIGCGIIVLAMLGCTQANTIGPETNKDLENRFTNHSGGTFVVYAPVSVVYESSDSTRQTTDNDPSQNINPSTALSSDGGTASLAAEGADMALKGISSLMDNSGVTSATKPAPATVKAREDAIASVPAVSDGEQVTVDTGKYHSRTNGDRPTWYFAKDMSEYPASFTIVIDGCEDIVVTENNGTRFESGNNLVKQSDVSGRGMAVLADSACKSTSDVELVSTGNKVTEVIEMKNIDGRSFAWLNETGKFYGGPVHFAFDNDCGEFTVNDAAVSQGADDQIYYFSGTDFDKDDPKYNDGKASIFGTPDCISKTVTMEYTKS